MTLIVVVLLFPYKNNIYTYIFIQYTLVHSYKNTYYSFVYIQVSQAVMVS